MDEYMPWLSEYSVGSDSVDEEHRQIVDLINDLHRLAVSPGGGAPIAVQTVLEQLMHYMIRHFLLEEQMMRDCGYPGVEDHQALHSRMRRRTAAMRTNMFQVTDREMLAYLKDWWHNHLTVEDQAYVPYLGVAVR